MFELVKYEWERVQMVWLSAMIRESLSNEEELCLNDMQAMLWLW